MPRSGVMWRRRRVVVQSVSNERGLRRKGMMPIYGKVNPKGLMFTCRA